MRVVACDLTHLGEAGTASQAASRRERVGVDMSGAGGSRSLRREPASPAPRRTGGRALTSSAQERVEALDQMDTCSGKTRTATGWKQRAACGGRGTRGGGETQLWRTSQITDMRAQRRGSSAGAGRTPTVAAGWETASPTCACRPPARSTPLELSAAAADRSGVVRSDGARFQPRSASRNSSRATTTRK